MIIKSTRIKTTSGTKNIKNHLLNKPEDNEKIYLFVGNEVDFETFHEFADEDKTMYSLRHFSINPGQSWTKDQMQESISKIREEYGATDRPYLVVGHDKKLADGSKNSHLHLIIPERFAGKTLDNKFAYQRNEKISRMCEYDFKHEITTGKHNRAVGHSLEDNEKYKELSKIMLEVHANKPRPVASYSANDLQISKRQGIDLPKLKLEIKDIHSRSDNYKSFKSGLEDNGYQIKKGEKAYIIETKDGTFLGSVNRLLKMKKSDFDKYIKGENYENNSKRNKTGHNSNIRTSSTSRPRPQQSRPIDRPNRNNERRNKTFEKRGKRNEVYSVRDIQKDRIRIQSMLLENQINNNEKSNIFQKLINEYKSENSKIKKFFNIFSKEERPKILDEIDKMDFWERVENCFIDKDLQHKIDSHGKPETQDTPTVEPQKTPEPTKPEPAQAPKPTPDFSKWETPKIGRMSGRKPDKKDKKPSLSIGSDTPVNLNNTLMEDKMRDKDLPAAPRPF